MNCDCGCSFGDYEIMEPCTIETRTARKVHTCCECGDDIKPGQRYEYVRGMCDGTWDTFRTCSVCVQIRGDYCDGWIYGQLRETLWDCLKVEL